MAMFNSYAKLSDSNHDLSILMDHIDHRTGFLLFGGWQPKRESCEWDMMENMGDTIVSDPQATDSSPEKLIFSGKLI